MDSAGRTHILARLVGFGLPAGLGLAILAGVVLVPAYAHLLEARYQRDCLRAANAADEGRITACRRLMRAIPEDPVLAKRLAMRQFGAMPRTEMVLGSAAGTAAPLLQVPAQALPQRPDSRVVAAARVLEAHPGKRQMLVLLGVGMVLAGMALSGRSQRRPRAVISSPGPPAP